MLSDHREANRVAPTWRQVINPVWLASDVERNMEWPWWLWFKRNPCCNLFMSVIGIAHRNRTCYYSKSGNTLAPSGINYGWSIADGRWSIPRPFVSYRCSWFETIVGWKTSGGLALSCRRANSPNATETPS